MGVRGKKAKGAYDALANTTEQKGAQTQQAIDAANQSYIDTANAAQAQYDQKMQAVREAEANRWANYAGGVEAMIAERQKEIDRAKEVANAEYMASQRAAQATGLTHLASSLANLIGVGGFNASNQVYHNPSMDWMKKAEQDKYINRQRMDNLRERQRAVQQHLLELKNQGAGALIALDRDIAGQGYQHGMNMAGAERENAINSAQLGFQIATQAEQARVQGTQAEIAADQQDAVLGSQNDRFAAQMRMQGRNPDGSINPAYVQEIQSSAGATSKGGGGGYRDDDDYLSFRVNAYQDMPQMDWEGSASWLVNTLLSSIDTITDIPENQKGQLRSLLQDPNKKAREKGELLQRFIGTSAQLRNLIQQETIESKLDDLFGQQPRS